MTEPEFKHIRVREDRGVLILEVVESALSDYDVCETLGRELEDAYHASSCMHVAVDLVNVEAATHVGYMPLLGLCGNVERSSGQMVVCNIADGVATVFATSRTLINPNQHDAPFREADDLEAAIAACTSES